MTKGITQVKILVIDLNYPTYLHEEWEVGYGGAPTSKNFDPSLPKYSVGFGSFETLTLLNIT